MIKKQFDIWVPDAFHRITAAEIAEALASMHPFHFWGAEDQTQDCHRQPGRRTFMEIDAPPNLLKAVIHRLDDFLMGLPDLDGKIKALREECGLWNNGVACRYDRLNEKLLEWEKGLLK